MNDLKIKDRLYLSLPDYTHSLLSTWYWKINPWQVTDDLEMSETCIITYNNSFIEVDDLGACSLIQSEKSGFYERRIYQEQDGGTQWLLTQSSQLSPLLHYHVDASWRSITLLKDETHTQGSAAFEYLAQIMPGVCLQHDLLSIHAAIVEYQHQAFIICAPSGTGKTTHARLWRDHKHALIINGDRAVIGQNGEQWMVYGTPWSGTSGEQIKREAPLTAMVILEQSPLNAVEEWSGLKAFTSMLPHLLYPTWDKVLAEKAVDLLQALLSDIPVYHLLCRPDQAAVEALDQALYGADKR